MTLRHWQMEKVSGSAEPLLSTTGNKGLYKSVGTSIGYDSTSLFGKHSVQNKHYFDTNAAGSLSDNEFTVGFWFKLPSSGGSFTNHHYVFQLGKYNTDVGANGHTCVGVSFSTSSRKLYFTTGYLYNTNAGRVELGSASYHTWYHCYISRTNSGANSTLQVKITQTDGTVVHDVSEVYTKADFSIDESGNGAYSYFMGHPGGGSLSIGGGVVEDFILKNGSVLSYASIYDSSAEVFQSGEPQVSVSTGAGSATLSDSNFTGTKTYSFYDTDATTLLQSGTSNSYTSYASSSVAYTALVTDTDNNRVISTFFISQGGNDMAILSSSVILPVEALGAIQVDSNGALSSSAIHVTGAASAEVAAGKALNGSLSMFSATGGGVKSVLSALNSIGGTVDSKIGLGNLGADGDLISYDGNGAFSTNAAQFSASVGAHLVDSISGDATIAAGGVLTIANNAVERDMLATGAVTMNKIASASVDFGHLDAAVISGQTALVGASIAQDDEFLLSDAGVVKKVSFTNLEDSIFNNVSGDATIAAGGVLTIANNAVERAMINTDAVGTDALDQAIAPTWTGDHKFNKPVQLLDQDNAGVYYKLKIQDGLLKVVSA